MLIMGCLAFPVVWALLALAARFGDASPAFPPHHSAKCNAATFRRVLVHSRAEITNVTFVPKGGSFGEGAANVMYPVNPTNLPELCALIVKVTSSPSSSYRFGLFLPTESHQWKERFFAVGNGGFGGGRLLPCPLSQTQPQAI